MLVPHAVIVAAGLTDPRHLSDNHLVPYISEARLQLRSPSDCPVITAVMIERVDPIVDRCGNICTRARTVDNQEDLDRPITVTWYMYTVRFYNAMHATALITLLVERPLRQEHNIRVSHDLTPGQLRRKKAYNGVLRRLKQLGLHYNLHQDGVNPSMYIGNGDYVQVESPDEADRVVSRLEAERARAAGAPAPASGQSGTQLVRPAGARPELEDPAAKRMAGTSPTMDVDNPDGSGTHTAGSTPPSHPE